MNKLTASRCRLRINELKFTENNHGLSNQGYDYLEALEIALPVLEQQEKGVEHQTDNYGWIEWKGGECPVSPESVVDVRWRAGGKMTVEAGGRSWAHAGMFCDIIAYRVIEQQEKASGKHQEGE
ncbi:hypothetical protein [Mixta mediterraneensis]|uniref:hypothetical protein n=1 Tax=Mixta mediterraneensis TaxID=2758443 RepID=UPI0018763D49|nr:hypothetical protein [Mixta mediterraneensis]MBE5254543.1 hypothetical protein [Mixta mediterraneensis]